MAKYKFRYIDCRECGHRITLQTYTGHVVSSRLGEDIKCPECHKESVYSGDDFRTSEGLVPSR